MANVVPSTVIGTLVNTVIGTVVGTAVGIVVSTVTGTMASTVTGIVVSIASSTVLVTGVLHARRSVKAYEGRRSFDCKIYTKQ